MKLLLPITILLLCILILGCNKKSLGVRSLGYVCSFGYESRLPAGIGVESELKRFETVAIMDTIAAKIELKITLINLWKGSVEEPAIGANVLIRKKGEEEILIGGCSDIKGEFQSFIEEGIYDIEFSFGGCNGLLVKNLTLKSGEVKEGDIKIGGAGKEGRIFEVNLAED